MELRIQEYSPFSELCAEGVALTGTGKSAASSYATSPCFDPNPHAILRNSGQLRGQITAYLCGIRNPVQTSTTTDRTLVMSRGKRFESARRLSRFRVDKRNTRKREALVDYQGLHYITRT